MGGNVDRWELIKVAAPIGISVIALVVSAAGFFLAWRRDRRDSAGKMPIATARISRVRDRDNWFEVQVKLQNRSDHGWRSTEMRVLKPRGAKLMMHSDGYGGESWNPEMLNPLPIARAAASLPIWNSVVGLSENATNHEKHHSYLSVFLFVPEAGRAVSLQMRLLSVEPVERRLDLTIKRTLPARNSSVSD